MKLKYTDTGYFYVENPGAVHGRHFKDMVVLHETISPDLSGLADILGVEQYLVNKGYGIHGMTDAEGNIAWAKGFGNAVFWQCGGVNDRSIGIEQVSKPPYGDSPKNIHYWAVRDRQLRATAKLLAAISNTWSIPLRYSNGDSPGITTHWSVSQIFRESQGHTDCHPVHLGGYYPVLSVLNIARVYSKVPHYTLTPLQGSQKEQEKIWREQNKPKIRGNK